VNWLAVQVSAIVALGWRRLIALAVVLLLLMSVDFYFRILVLRDTSLRLFTTPAVTKVSAPLTTESVSQKLEMWVPKKVVVEAPPPPSQLALQAIFGAGRDARVIIALIPPDGSPPQRFRVAAGEVVDGWTVERVGRAAVSLKKGEETKELLLFRPVTE